MGIIRKRTRRVSKLMEGRTSLQLRTCPKNMNNSQMEEIWRTFSFVWMGKARVQHYETLMVEMDIWKPSSAKD